jgi:hypothetical protein
VVKVADRDAGLGLYFSADSFIIPVVERRRAAHAPFAGEGVEELQAAAFG